jgi:hypothetical protein
MPVTDGLGFVGATSEQLSRKLLSSSALAEQIELPILFWHMR